MSEVCHTFEAAGGPLTGRRQMADLNFKEALRALRLEEARLRSAALAFSCGIGSFPELTEAADNYGRAARHYKQVERALGGATLTPDEAEVVR